MSGDFVRDRRVVAIVGARKADEAARAFATELAEDLANAGMVVVSGGAKGIDAAAHRGALNAGGITWAILGTGFGETYPIEHEDLYDEIMLGPGACVWPFEPGTQARAQNFPFRNRILAALADVVVVIQADVQSGALNAAMHARELGREVWAAPGPPWSPHQGCNELLDSGARPLRSKADLFEALKIPYIVAPPPPRRSRQKRRKLPNVPKITEQPQLTIFEGGTNEERRVLEVLDSKAKHFEHVVRESGLSAGQVRTALLTLTLMTVVVEAPLQFFRRA